MENRPQGREKNVTGHGKPVARRGSGMGTGPVGAGANGGYSGRPTNSGRGTPSRGTGGGGGGLMRLIIIGILVLAFGGGSFSLFGDSDDSDSYVQPQQAQTVPTYAQSSSGQSQPDLLSTLFGSLGTSSGMSQGFNYSSLFPTSTSQSATVSSSGWTQKSNVGILNTKVDSAAREKRTEILGNGNDTVTIMVYMCGTDLESKSGMATKDLQEMLNAKLSDHVNLLVYTGGCSRWQNNVISSNVNQIYQVVDGGLRCLVKDAGNEVMTSSKTLSSFITFCSEHFPANRNMLILWDHGAGSISGYGYDEKAKSAGSMTLKGLNDALTSAKTKFDFIGFDACLMATLETGLTMANHADYLVASEETEPGLGWYYTDWLTKLSADPAMPTIEIGKNIADDFVKECGRSCPGQKTTLSVVDLAELEKTIPDDFKAFSESTLSLLKNNGYETVSNARIQTREFSSSSKLDQIDLVHLALNLGTPESKELAESVLSAVKYNRTSSNMTNAYGLSLYFPYQKTGKVNSAVATYNAIGMDDSYTDCIRMFASLEVGGQTAAGGTASPFGSLSGQSSGSTVMGTDVLTQMLTQILGGSDQGLSFFDRSIDPEETAQYLVENRLDSSLLQWTSSDSGYVMHMPESQWQKVQDLELNVFVDDGEGYIDLGLDNTFDFTMNGDLIGAYDGTWIAIDEQPVAYYHVDTTVTDEGYIITGRVPVLLNGDRAELILVFTSEDPYGSIAGARMDYHDGETETIAKGITELNDGDVIDFLCDYYTYNGEYQDSYLLGEQMIYTGEEQISNVYIDAPTNVTYRFTDIYNNHYWTEIIPE